MTAPPSVRSPPLSPPSASSPLAAGPSRPAPSRKPSLAPSAAAPTDAAARIRPSRRASGMSAASPGVADAERRRARREQLRNFYGLKGVDEGGQGPAKGKEVAGEGANDLNAETFDAAAYYEDLISKSTLEELMKTASTLAGEIGNLQSSRHSLVYNHHHQLFSAGDTISHLNSRTPELLGIMTELQASFSEMSRLSDAVAAPATHSGMAAMPEAKKFESAKQLGERVRLMILAEEPPDKVRERYEAFLIALESLEEAQRSELKGLRLDCEALVGQLPELPIKDIAADANPA